ncbi:hypothetical protein SESBI_23951 [Sesbania bispinosa]|nr:hypothetical protein SESBI_23951 [Sesbania bispinosa]
MSSLAQHKYFPSFHHQVSTRRPLLHPVRVYCSTTTTSKPKPRPNDKQLIIEPGLVSPPPTVVTATNRPIDNDPSLQSTWSHRAWVVAGCTTLLISLGESIKGAVDLHMWVEPILAGWVGYILADLGSGVYHWAIDNYGDGSTPIVEPKLKHSKGTISGHGPLLGANLLTICMHLHV